MLYNSCQVDNRKNKHPDHIQKLPSNTAMGFYIGVCSFLFGFAVIWEISWLTLLSCVGMIVFVILRLYEKNTDYYISAKEVEKIESSRGGV